MRRIISSKKQLGQGMTEYIIIVALIAIGSVALFTAFGGVVRHQVSAITLGLTNSSQASSETGLANGDATAGKTLADKTQDMSDFGQNSGDATVNK
jgi:pilus assembly protein Flp/PilA